MTKLNIIENLCNHYQKSTNMKCTFVDINNKISSVTCCELCRKINKYSLVKDPCMDMFKYSYYQAERFGGKYIFFCTIGLVHWCNSIKLEDGTKGVIICGPVTIIDHDEYIEDEVFSKIDTINPKIKNEFYEMVRSIPKVEPDIVTSLSELLNLSVSNGIIKNNIKVEPNRKFVDNVQQIKEQSKNISKIYSLSKEKELIKFIKDSKEEKAREILNEILASIFVINGININILRSRVFELVVLLSRGVVEIGVDVEEIFGMNCYLLDDINNIDDLDELLRWSNDILNKFMDLSFKLKNIKNKDIIFKSLAYVKTNYMCKITLEDVANYVSLSPTYFSSIFKKQMNLNFSDYLNNIRIENSKRLLKDNSIKLIDVSYLVGFESQSYFTKVFKKVEGQTPKQYRQSNISLE